MIIGLKDCLKLIGIIIVSFCAVFVCTFFLNYYLDASALQGTITDANTIILFNAQMATAKFTCAISGGFLAVIAVVMLVFYIKLYIDGHSARLGIMKAMGYSEFKISLYFAVFGIAVLIGTALGFGAGFLLMPTIYENMTLSGMPEISITFHPLLLICLVVLPTVVFSAISCLFALLYLRVPALNLLYGRKKEKAVKAFKEKDNNRGFLLEMCLKTLKNKKLLAFFVAFAAFCFSAMVQMSVSMVDLSTEIMGGIIFAIGVVLAVTSAFMSVTSIVNNNIKNIAIMKAYGYSLKECAVSVLGGYSVFAAIGFIVGTVYQYGLLSIMVNVVYKDVGEVPDYSFDVPAFFITLGSFIILYFILMLGYTYKINRITVKEVMAEN